MAGYRFWQIHRIPLFRAFLATDELEGQTQNGGVSFRGNLQSILNLVPAGPQGPAGPAGADGSCIARVVDLSPEDILNLNTVPIELVPAQGANKCIVAAYGFAWFHYDGSSTYTAPGDALLSIIQGADLDTGYVILSTFPDLGSWAMSQDNGNSWPYAYVSESLLFSNQPLMLQCNRPITTAGGGTGPIFSTTLLTGSFSYAVGDTGYVNDGNMNATYVIDTVNSSIGTATLNAGGSGYSVNDTGVVTGGGATYRVSTVSGGAVVTFVITDGGTGYVTTTGAATTTGGAQPGSGTGFKINFVTGRVLTYHLTSNGDGYTTEPDVNMTKSGDQPGIGQGFVVDVLVITDVSSSVRFVTFYSVVTVPAPV